MVNANERYFASFRPRTVFGIDFSGAKLAGENAWIAKMEVLGEPDGVDAVGRGKPPQLPLSLSSNATPGLRLVDLRPLERAAGEAERSVVCRYLAESILESRGSLWGMDFPFGLPIELGLGDWKQQLQHVRDHDGDAKSYGRELVQRAKDVGESMHIRRASDLETKTPFDCYHYRIIYQTFHGMRDVLAPIAGQGATAVMPFERDAWTPAAEIERVIVEACPSSTLKRWSLPHQNYKQPGKQPPDAIRRKTRQTILKTVSRFVEISSHRRRVMMTNPGGDALDAVLAGVGAWQAWHRDDHAGIAAHPRYHLEGRVYC